MYEFSTAEDYNCIIYKDGKRLFNLGDLSDEEETEAKKLIAIVNDAAIKPKAILEKFSDLPPTPAISSIWQHYSGRLYTVLMITNEANTNPNYPVTVVYMNVNTGSRWSRPLFDWHRSMTLKTI